MPLNRYQLRNEYCLADPELYKVANKDDPEALLEGVAMAGLVGVLRQLGDLAEFAAEIFHDLHEEVMSTAARGHGLIVRVQQLEAEFPSIERTLLSQTSHTAFLYNTGVDWHPNLCMDQSVVTGGDLPRFVMDSYEECRGPPRLFLLDKYDVAGAGACLKRFTDPSFFKTESTSSTGRKLEGQREKKTRRVKKRGPRWRNGDTPESFPSSHAKLHQLFLEERIESGINDPARRVKLKKRQFTGSLFEQDNVRSYMEKFLDTSAPEQKTLHEICMDPLQLTWTSDKVCEPGLEIVEIATISPVKELRQTERSICLSPDAKEIGIKPLMDDLSQDKLNVRSDNETVELPGLNNESNVGNVSTVPKEVRVDDACDFDDVASEIDNYVDALANIESEVETDYECKKQPRYLNWKPVVADSDGSERQRRLQSFSLDSQSIGNSATSDDGDLFFKERESSSCSNSVNTLSETVPDLDAAAVAVSAIQASNSDSDNMSFDHHSTSEEILRKEREKHASGNTVLTEVNEVLKSEQEFREASNASSLSDLNKKNLPVDMEARLKENPFLSDPVSEDTANSDVLLGETDQGHTIQATILSSHTTYSEASEDSRHCSGVNPFSSDLEGQYTSADPDMSQGMSNILDGSVHLLETSSHTSACSSVEGPDKNLARADTDRGLTSQHEPVSEPVYLEKTNSIYLACEEDFLISSTEEDPKYNYSATESSVSYGLQELIPGIMNPGHTSSLDIAAGNLSWSQEDPSMQSSIATSEGRISSAPHVGEAENSAISNELQSCAPETSSSEITEAAEINDCGFFEADVAVVASSKDESHSEVSKIADEGINESSKVAKPSNIIDVLESQDDWLKLPPEATDTTLPESSQDEASKQYYDNDACTTCLIPVGGDEDEASVHFDYIEREPVDQDFSSIYPDRKKVFEPDNLANDPASEPATMHGEANADYGLADQDGEEDRIFNQGLSSPEAPFKHADDSHYILVAENYSDLDHDLEKVEHIEIVADGHGQNVNVDHHPNEILSTSLVLPSEKLHEPPLLNTEKLWQSDEEFSKGHSGELTERRQVDFAQDASVAPTANMCSTPSNDSFPLTSLDDALPEDVKINDNLKAEAPLAFDRSSEHLEPTSSQQINLLEASDLDLLNYNLLKPQHDEKEKSADPAALHYDDQPAASKTSPESAEHTLESSADQPTQVEKLAQPQPRTQSGSTEPQINLEPPSLPPLPPMQWRLGRFQNAAAVSAERQMVQHTFAPVQVPSMGLPIMHRDLAPVQPMNLAAVHQALASFQPVALAAGNNTVTPIPLASQPSSLPAVYTFAPLQPVTLQTTDYGTETIARTISSEGQLGYSDGYVAQQGVYALPVPVAVSEGFYQMNMNAVGRQDNLPSTVPLTSTNLDGYVTQPGAFVTPIPAVVSAGSSQIDSSGVGRPHSLPLSVSSSPSRSPDGTQNLEASYQPNVDAPESGSLVKDHFSEHRSTMEATVNAETDVQNELLEHAQTPEETVNSYVQSLLSSAADQPPPGLVAPEAARTWSSTYDEIPTHTDGNINGTLQKKAPRPRNPLIDEVVAIDKSKLRKVERTKPPVESKQEEAEHRLEQMQLRKVERVKPPVESKVEGGEYRLEQLQLRKVGERVKAPVDQKAEEEFSLEQLQLRKVGERVKSAVEPKFEEKEFLPEQFQLRKVGLKPKLEAETKVEETGSPLAQLRKVRERVREEFELKTEETESPRLQLRKVGERAQTQVEEKVEERDSLFEQIRNKSFSLKPAVAARPNIQGPRTNLKVAAILEKASTIRQAMAGSDEDEDGDSWSDS